MQMNQSPQHQDPVTVDITAGDLPPDTADTSGQVVGYVSCPEALVSKLIGKKGAVIQTLETLTGAKIQVEHQKAGDPKHVRIVAKSQEDLDKTKNTIKETLESEHPLGEVTKVISCPHAMVGRIIGRAGQTILSLQQASQAKIVVDQDPERFPEGAPRDVRLIGMAHCVERAEKMVDELIHAEPGVSAQSVIQKVGITSINSAILSMRLTPKLSALCPSCLYLWMRNTD
jgi:rRNA processing protein Krr1/Pno1